MKLHLALDVSNGKAYDYRLTHSRSADAPVAVKMLTEGGLANVNIDEFLADGAYDNYDIYKVLARRKIQPNVKIRKNAKYKKGNDQNLVWRNKSIDLASQKVKRRSLCSALREQRIARGYGKRSLVETFFSRYKAYYGDRFMSRKRIHAEREVAFKVRILNQFA